MAYAGVSSVLDIAKGFQAVEDMKAAPAATEAAIEKSKYETSRYKGLQDYMKKEAQPAQTAGLSAVQKGAEGIDKALSAGSDAYGVMNLGQELSQRKNALRQEEQNLKMLAPEDRAHAEATIERMQKDIDSVEGKLLKQAEAHLGERFSLLDSVKDQASLDGARDYAKRALGAMADKAIADGKIHPSNRDAFINDQLNSFLPKTYDKAGKAQLDTERNGMMSMKDQIDMKKADAANKRAMAELEKADAANRRQTILLEKQLRSGDTRILSEERQNITNQVASNNKMIEDYERELANQQKNMQGMPDTISTGIFSSDVNPNKQIAKDRIEDLRVAIEGLRASNNKLGLQREVLMEKIGVPSVTESAPKAAASNESAAVAAWGSYEPDKYDYRINPDTGKIQRKAK